jgi:hypothetical protein
MLRRTGAAGLPTGRYGADEPDWSYEATAREILAEAGSALDMGTGEGGILASLAPLPKLTVAYEGVVADCSRGAGDAPTTRRAPGGRARERR